MKFFFKIISCTLLFISLIGCQQETKKKPFKIAMTIKIEEDDSFQLFYTTSKNEKFSTQQHYKKIGVLGKNEFQTICFDLTLQKPPNNFRIDLGENQHETPIEIKSIELIFKKDTVRINGATVHRFFHLNESLQKIGNQTFLRKKIDLNYDPFLVATPLLHKKIELAF